MKNFKKILSYKINPYLIAITILSSVILFAVVFLKNDLTFNFQRPRISDNGPIERKLIIESEETLITSVQEKTEKSIFGICNEKAEKEQSGEKLLTTGLLISDDMIIAYPHQDIEDSSISIVNNLGEKYQPKKILHGDDYGIDFALLEKERGVVLNINMNEVESSHFVVAIKKELGPLNVHTIGDFSLLYSPKENEEKKSSDLITYSISPHINNIFSSYAFFSANGKFIGLYSENLQSVISGIDIERIARMLLEENTSLGDIGITYRIINRENSNLFQTSIPQGILVTESKNPSLLKNDLITHVNSVKITPLHPFPYLLRRFEKRGYQFTLNREGENRDVRIDTLPKE